MCKRMNLNLCHLLLCILYFLESSIGAGSDVSVICETQPDMLNSSIDSSMGASEHSYSVLGTNEETVINKAKVNGTDMFIIVCYIH